MKKMLPAEQQDMKRALLPLLCIILVAVLMPRQTNGQDTQFSQFYATGMYMNPAFTGSAHNLRAHAHQRLQWPGIKARYRTSLISVDHFVSEYKSGFGLMVMRDVQGNQTINNTSASLLYSYELPITDQYTIRTGVQFGYVSRSIGYSDLTFPDQYSNYGMTSGNNRYGDNNRQRRNQFADFSTGFMLYSKRLWLSVAGHHLNQPNQSMLGEVSRLPAKYSIVAGYKIPIAYSNEMAYLGEDEIFASISPTFHYKMQGKSDQAEAGLYGTYGDFMGGIWYRGIPFKRYRSEVPNNESIVVLTGVKFDNFSVRYSYDFTLSRLTTINAGGAHEIGITYVIPTKERDQVSKTLPCPEFQ